ncbi:TLDc domain-containing protein [Entamoeba marina]
MEFNPLNNIDSSGYHSNNNHCLNKEPFEVILSNSILIMEEWCGLKFGSILFDSDIMGNGKNTLALAVMNKKHLYFITMDSNGNVYGGYFSSTITETGYNIDDGAFVFSLTKEHHVVNKKFELKDNIKYVFWLGWDNYYLYEFGADVAVCCIGNSDSWCDQDCFIYNNDSESLWFLQWPNTFSIDRIVVVQMV